MRLKTLVELRRHIRAIDVALKDEIDYEKKPQAQNTDTYQESESTKRGQPPLKRLASNMT
jgi:hypothetical protein